MLSRRFTHRRMIDHEQIELSGKLFQRRVGKLLQRPRFPADFYAGIQFAKALRRRDHGEIAARVPPGYAVKLDHNCFVFYW